MQYQYQGSLAREKSIDALWSAPNLANVDINTIYSQYKKVYLILSHPALTGTVYLDMEAARPIVGAYIGVKTVSQWLASLGNASLPTTTQVPQTVPKPALYEDAWRAGYNIQPVDRTRSPDAQLPPADKNDLLLTKGNLDFRQWGRFLLTTVNGYYHRSVGSAEGLYIVDGAKTGRIGNDNQVGLLSFREVGPLRFIPILPDMVYKNSPNQKLANAAFIELPEDFDDKTILLVIGGHLHALDRSYIKIGAKSLKVDINNFSLPDRILRSWGEIDYSQLGLEQSPNNPKQIAVEDLYSDDVVRAYLTLSQSFIVVLDTPSVYVRKHPVERTGLPGRFISPTPFQRFPLFSEYGKCFDYRALPDHGQTLLACDTAKQLQYTFRTAPWLANRSIDQTTYDARPWHHAQGYQLEIGRFGN